jgi:hypothetical protein
MDTVENYDGTGDARFFFSYMVSGATFNPIVTHCAETVEGAAPSGQDEKDQWQPGVADH